MLKFVDKINTNPTMLGSICALIATILWAGNFICGRILANSIPPFTVVTLRCLIATIILIPFALKHINDIKEQLRLHFKFYMLVAFVGVSIPHSFIYFAAQTVSAVNLSIIAISTPLWVILLMRILYKEKISVSRAVGLLIVISGILCLISRGDIAVLLNLHFSPGDLFMLVNAISFSSYTIIMRKVPKGVSTFLLLFLSFSLGLVQCFPLSMIELFVLDAQVHLSTQTVIAIFYTAICASLIASGTWFLAVVNIGPTKAAIIYYTIPLFCAVGALLILGESILSFHLYSSVLIMFGLILATHQKSRL